MAKEITAEQLIELKRLLDEQYPSSPDTFRWVCEECRPDNAEIKTIPCLVDQECHICGLVVAAKSLSLINVGCGAED